MIKEMRKILIIDDDAGMVRLAEKWFRVDGYEVIGALTGVGGIKRAQTENPDLILLDVMIPDLTGVEVAKKLYADPATKNIPIIFMTVCIGVENDKGNENMEIDGRSYRAFAKPLHTRKLLSAARKLINFSKNNQPI
ncbi:MAG: response regulator [Candidatus Omnitrophica bacterium]|nr:response regulator [Candidatus Omnitrophota bacterium]